MLVVSDRAQHDVDRWPALAGLADEPGIGDAVVPAHGAGGTSWGMLRYISAQRPRTSKLL